MTVRDDQPAALRPLFGLGSILLAGFIGGPLAAGVLAFHNVRSGTPERTRNIVLAFFIAASLVWLWCTSHVPPDLISHLVVHVPLWIVWSVFAAALLRPRLATHKAEGGTFKSAWRAAWIAVQINVGMILLALAIGLILSQF